MILSQESTLTLKLTKIAELFVLLCFGLPEESYLRKMIALTVISPNRSQGLFTSISSTAILQRKKENSPL